MEEILKKTLDDGEKLLWNGRPEIFETLDKTYKPIFIKKLIISAAIGIFLTVGYILLAQKNDVPVKWGLFVILWAFCALSPTGIFTDAKKLSRSTIYGMTDRRLITLIDTDTVRSVTFEKLEKMTFITDADDHTSLICGTKAKKEASGNLRAEALSSVSLDDEEKCGRFVMYGIQKADKLRKLLADYLTEF